MRIKYCYVVFAVKCSVCKSVSDTYDPYLDIALEIRVRFRVRLIVTNVTLVHKTSTGVNSQQYIVFP